MQNSKIKYWGLTSQNVQHFFESVAANAEINVHLEKQQEIMTTTRQKALFKAFGFVKRGVRVTGSGIPSTKGVL